MWRRVIFTLVFATALFGGAASAGAVVIDPAKTGSTPVQYNASERENYVGVTLVPGTRNQLEAAEIPTVKSNGPCTDPALAPDLNRPKVLESGLCSHGGAVMHGNETFALVWDPYRRYYSGTKGYVEQFLRQVADGSGTLTSPYAVVTQYADSTGRAANKSLYGGACEDFGIPGGSACEFVPGSGAGHNYPGCTETETVCHLTDTQLRSELTAMIEQTGIIGRTQTGYTPTVVLLTPGGVETCIVAGGLCSANGTSIAQFCSYHSRVNVKGAVIDYVVQPSIAETSCFPGTPPASAAEFGERLVVTLAQAQIGAIVNPEFNGWFALDGSEINDNGVCQSSKSVTMFNNGALLVKDPYTTPECAAGVQLVPGFVVSSPMNQGRVVAFDGSISPSTLVVPAAGYAWEFGDGMKGTGPSVEHVYAQGGVYSVKLTLTDRGGNEASITQTIDVMGPPVGVGAPAISDATSPGGVTAGDNLQGSTGSWAGYPTPSYAYQWLRCNAAGGDCAAIAGANGSTYTPTGADVGHTIRLEVTASNSVGTGKATSPQTSVVAVQPPPMLQVSGGIAAVSGPAGTGPAPQEFQLKALLGPESLRQLFRNGVDLRASTNQAADGVASIFISAAEARHVHIYFRHGQSRVMVGRGTIKSLSGAGGSFHLRLSRKVMSRLRHLTHVTLTVQLLALNASGQRRVVTVAGRY